MQVSISASGTPSQVAAQVQTQIKQARAQNDQAGPVLNTVKDYISQLVAGAKAEDTVSVSASVYVGVTIPPATEE